MLRRNALVVLALAGGICSATTQAAGAYLTYANRATFLAHGDNVTTYGFETSEGFPSATGGGSGAVPSFAGGTITTSVPVGIARTQIYPAGSGNQVLGEMSFSAAPFAPTPLTLNLSPARRAIGFDAYMEFANMTESIDVRFDDGSTGTFSIVDVDGNLATPNFFGITSDSPIASLTTSGHVGSLNGQETLMDNLSVDVPEPAAMATFAAVAAVSITAFRSVSRSRGRTSTWCGGL